MIDKIEKEQEALSPEYKALHEKRVKLHEENKYSLMADLAEQLELDRRNAVLVNEMNDEMTKYQEQLETQVNTSRNQHEKLSALADHFEMMLERVNRQVPKEEFRNIDNTPKSLLHMTEEDMKPKSPEVLRDELNELIKEARTKIKPVLMSKIERDQYIRPKEDFDKMHEQGLIINIDPRGCGLLDSE